MHWILFLFFSLLGCNREIPSHIPTVLVSIPPYLTFIDKIAGSTVITLSVVPAGSNPHLFDPTPQELAKAVHATLWVKIGEPFERKLASTLKDNRPDLHVIDATEGIALLPIEESSCCEGYDRHIWMSARLAQIQAKTIALGLIKAFPKHKEFYEKNLEKFLHELAQLDHEMSSLLLPFKGDAILVSHPAFSYLCRDYDLKQISIEYEGKDPLPQHIQEILQRSEKEKIRVVLTQAQYNNKGALLFSETLKLPHCLVDPYAEDYEKNLLFIAQTIANPKSACD